METFVSEWNYKWRAEQTLKRPGKIEKGRKRKKKKNPVFPAFLFFYSPSFFFFWFLFYFYYLFGIFAVKHKPFIFIGTLRRHHNGGKSFLRPWIAQCVHSSLHITQQTLCFAWRKHSLAALPCFCIFPDLVQYSLCRSDKFCF